MQGEYWCGAQGADGNLSLLRLERCSRDSVVTARWWYSHMLGMLSRLSPARAWRMLSGVGRNSTRSPEAEEQPHQRAVSALHPAPLAGRCGASCPSARAASLIVQKEQPSKDSLLLKAKCQSLALTQPFSNSIKLWKGLRATFKRFYSHKNLILFKSSSSVTVSKGVRGGPSSAPPPFSWGNAQEGISTYKYRRSVVQQMCCFAAVCRRAVQVKGKIARS